MRGQIIKIEKANKALIILLTCLLIVFLLTSSIILSNSLNKAEEAYADTTWTGKGTGSETDPYLITTAEELGTFRDIVNATGAEKHAVLGNDITLSGDWDPIGSDDKPFKGTFDGNCHTVFGIKFNEPSTGHVGFFANVTYCNSGTEIKNLTVKGDGIISSSDTGGIVGWLEGRYQSETKIINCHNYLPITSGSQVGGIVGNATSGLLKISDCSNHATITATGNGYNVGGIVGSATGPSTWDAQDNKYVLKVDIENCYNDGAITVTSSSTNVGGIVGKTAGVVNVKKCFNYNSVKGSTETFAVIAELGSSSSISGCCYLTISGSATDERADGHDAAWFKDKNNFTQNEDFTKIWDFTNTWEIKENGNYPTFLPEVDLYIAGHIVAVGSTSVTRTNRGYQYDRQANTLILNNSSGYDSVYFIIEAPSWDAGIRSELADLNIRMCWKSSIDNKNSGEELTRYGIYSTGNLRFTTSYEGDHNGLKIQATSGKSKNAYGIYCEGIITLERGYLDVTAGDINEDGKTIGIYAKSMTVLGGKIVANSYYKSDYSTQIGVANVGIETEEGITIKEGIEALIAYGRTSAVVGKLVTECSGAGYAGIPGVLCQDSSYWGSNTRADIVGYPSYLWNDYTSDFAIAKGTYEHMEDIECDPDDSTRRFSTLFIVKTPIHILAHLEYKQDEGYELNEIHYNDPVPAEEDYKHNVEYSSEYLTEGSLYDLVESKVTITSSYYVGGFGKYHFRNSNEAGWEDFAVGNYDYTIVTHGSFEIDKAVPDYVAPTPRKLLYTGENQDLIIPGSIPENPNVQSTIEYKVDLGSYSTAVPQKKDTYTYTVTYRVTPTDTDHYVIVEKYFYVRIDLHDKTALEEALASARYNRDLLYNGGLDTTNLDNAIFSANNVLETGSATEEDINNAISNLNEATTNSTVGLYKTLISEITLPITDLSKESDIKTLKALYDVMTDEQKAQLTQEEKDKLEPAVLQLATELIKDIGDPKQVTSPESKGKIDNAKGFYGSLSDAQKAQISNANNLSDAEDYLAVDDFKDKIDAIGAPQSVTYPESKTAIQDANDAYAGLTDAQKALVDPNTIKALQDAEDYYAADKAKDLINAIGTVEYPASSAAINAARDAYEALTDAQKALVGNYGDLEEAEDTYGDLAASDVADKINAIGDPKQVTSPESKAVIDAANNAYNQLPASQRGKIPADVLKNLEDANDYYAADEAKDKIEEIGDPADVKHTDEYKEKIDAAKVLVDKLTPNQRSLIPSALEDYEEAFNRYEAEGVKDLIAAIGNPADIKHTDEYKEKIDAARDAYDALTDAQKALVDNIGDLEDAEDQYEAQGVIDLIKDIDNVSLDDEYKEKIREAKEAYNNLTDEQKALIPSDVLNDYEAIVEEFNELVKEDLVEKVDDIGTITYDDETRDRIERAMADYELLTDDEKSIIPQESLDKLEDAIKAFDTMDAINSIGAVEYTSESKAKIDTAKEKYDALTPTQKSYVVNAQELLDAKDTYDKVDNVVKHIETIGEVQNTPESKQAVEEARKLYNELTEEQKALVPAGYIKTLEDDEAIVATFKNKHGFCVGWVVFILDMLLLLVAALAICVNIYVAKGNEKVKELLNKIKMNFLVTRKYLLTFIFLGVSNILFIFALVALCLHQCPGSITAFVIATIINCAAIALFVLMFRIIELLDDDDEQPKVEDKKVEDVKEEKKEDEGLSLKESIALAKANTSDHKFTKAYVSEYLKNREDVEVNARDNYTRTGLPLADTLYAEKDGKKTCFAYVYEIDGSMILLAKMNSKYANELKKKHPQVNLSAFPKQKDAWYSLIIDDTYTKEDFDKIIDDISS